MITVKDLAKELNLHHTTISKALRDHPDISKETKDKVTALAKKRDYHPNLIAQNFKRKRSNMIGVIVPSIKNDFFSTVISGIEEVVYAAGYTIMVCQSNESAERQLVNLRSLIANRVAGVLISIATNTISSELVKLFANQDVSLVFFDRPLEEMNKSRVVNENYQGAFKLVEYLIERGYKLIAHFSGPENISTSFDRFRGYRDALQKNHLPFDNNLVVLAGFEEENGKNAFTQFMKRGIIPDAIFAVNDPVARGVYTGIQAQGLSIPTDIAVAGFGDNTISSFLTPPLTTVSQFPYKMGLKAAEIILNQIEQGTISVPKEEMIKSELIIREST